MCLPRSHRRRTSESKTPPRHSLALLESSILWLPFFHRHHHHHQPTTPTTTWTGHHHHLYIVTLLKLLHTASHTLSHFYTLYTLIQSAINSITQSIHSPSPILPGDNLQEQHPSEHLRQPPTLVHSRSNPARKSFTFTFTIRIYSLQSWVQLAWIIRLAALLHCYYCGQALGGREQ